MTTRPTRSAPRSRRTAAPAAARSSATCRSASRISPPASTRPSRWSRTASTRSSSGLPYSDPVMDGLAIQKATQAALAAGFRVRDVFTAVEAIRARVDAPVLVMTYWNPVLQYGVDRFADDLVDAGGAGLITPDITPDSARRLDRDERTHRARPGLPRGARPRPTPGSPTRSHASRGFVYAVSTMGVTGARARRRRRRPRASSAACARRITPRTSASESASRPATRSPRCSTTPTARSSVPALVDGPRRARRRGRRAHGGGARSGTQSVDCQPELSRPPAERCLVLPLSIPSPPPGWQVPISIPIGWLHGVFPAIAADQTHPDPHLRAVHPGRHHRRARHHEPPADRARRRAVDHRRRRRSGPIVLRHHRRAALARAHPPRATTSARARTPGTRSSRAPSGTSGRAALAIFGSSARRRARRLRSAAGSPACGS